MSATLALLLALSGAADADRVVVRRFALIAAANDGGRERPRLRYAVTDARALAGVLEELGGVAPEDRVMVVEPTRDELLASIDALEGRLQAARAERPARLELVFYYSGHSDETGLLLGEDGLPYGLLRSRLDALAADVRIAILDSCASGAITRKKGGKLRPPFLVDRSSQVKGFAVLTSSSENEAAQESDRIRGSFFTHYLVSGLRGAADVTTDGRVTLNEAYAFAFHETLRRTEKTLGGAQHAAYDIQLAGSGDLVMTDVNATSATLGLPESLGARVFVRDDRGKLVAELDKPGGRRVELGLAPGQYEITLESKRTFRRSDVALVEGKTMELDPAAMTLVEGEETFLRGDDEPDDVVLLDFGVLPALSLNGNDARRKVENHVMISLGWGHAYRLSGAALALGAASTSENMTGVQIAVGVTSVGGYAKGAQLSAGVNFASVMDGLQATAGVNVSGRLLGAQLTSGVNFAQQLTGLQMAAGLNVVEEGRGAQLAIVNAAQRFAGLQLGLVNLAGHNDGFQLGLLNLSDSNDGESIGLISYSLEDGILRPSVFSSDVGLASVGLSIGTGHLYTLFFAGTGSIAKRESVSFGLGLGATFPVGEHFRLDVDVRSGTAWATQQLDRPSQLLSTARVRLGWRVLPWLTLFAGPAYHVAVDSEVMTDDDRIAPSYAWAHGDDVRSWLGGSVGIELLR
ncbi:MAG: caspase family protein [Deltaproteobacteria bacterium]